MGANSAYWIGAGILVLVVVILLVVWNVNQLSRQSQPAQKKRKEKATHAEHKREKRVQLDKEERNIQDQVDVRQEMMAEPVQSIEQSVKAANAVDRTAKLHSLRTVTRVRKHGNHRPLSITDQESSIDFVHTRQATPLLGNEFAEAPVVIEQHDVELALDPLDEDQVLRLSAYETLTAQTVQGDTKEQQSSENEAFSDLLRVRLHHKAVLGWLLLAPSGTVVDSDQVYDEEVIQQLVLLASTASATAALVGLTHAREFLVRGVEGMILLIPAMRLIPEREEYVVVFIESEEAYELILKRLLLEEE
ncbi:hypothetical protein [Sulfoacidibacillus thermotolerans]|uniref:Roadblock/LAMTOR2 domain-containing protein n=1 Tax=Sulfoacidibacillus thermotolerans TaxID=1765684 RepID=A0A2U3D8Y6_SULT2|nr:hypothetical protein [Sulfoacidibacillus thermotolerans]PWI57754.1 hypothetical protein BM613_07170 [Sulfoacidibacillus thermotolerans]